MIISSDPRRNPMTAIRLLPMLLFVFLFIGRAANAQIVSKTGSLQVGDTLPDLAINYMLLHKTKNAKLSSFREKAIILDFWATWCSACVGMMPRMDSLQKKFQDSVQFLSVTYQQEKTVSEFIRNLAHRMGSEISLPIVVEDSILQRWFPHIYLPHYVWIGRGGVVRAFTGMEEINEKQLTAFLREEKTILTQKKDPVKIAYDRTRPFLINGNGGDGTNLIYQSVLTRHSPGLKDGFFMRKDSVYGTSVSLFNVPLYWYYRTAFGEGNTWFGLNRLEIHLKAPQKFMYLDSCGSYEEWKKKNSFCYQLVTPPSLENTVFQVLKADLDRLFPMYNAIVEKRTRKCWVLSRLSNKSKLSSTGEQYISRFDQTGYTLKNAPLKAFISDMNLYWLQKSPYPMVDETGFTGYIDLDIQADMTDMKAISAQLVKHGLKISLEKKKIDVLVIRDNSF